MNAPLSFPFISLSMTRRSMRSRHGISPLESLSLHLPPYIHTLIAGDDHRQHIIINKRRSIRIKFTNLLLLLIRPLNALCIQWSDSESCIQQQTVSLQHTHTTCLHSPYISIDDSWAALWVWLSNQNTILVAGKPTFTHCFPRYR